MIDVLDDLMALVGSRARLYNATPSRRSWLESPAADEAGGGSGSARWSVGFDGEKTPARRLPGDGEIALVRPAAWARAYTHHLSFPKRPQQPLVFSSA